MSVWQTPQATSRTSTSPALGSARSTSCTAKRRPELLEHRGSHLHGRAPYLDAAAQLHPQAVRAHREAQRSRGGGPASSHSKLRASIASAVFPSRNARLRPGQKRGPAPKDRNVFGSWPCQPAVGVEALGLAGRARLAGEAATRVPAGSSTPADGRVGERLDEDDRRDRLQPRRLAEHGLGEAIASTASASRGVRRRPARRRPRPAAARWRAGSWASSDVAQASVLAVVSSPANSIVKTLPITSRSLYSGVGEHALEEVLGRFASSGRASMRAARLGDEARDLALDDLERALGGTVGRRLERRASTGPARGSGGRAARRRGRCGPAARRRRARAC